MLPKVTTAYWKSRQRQQSKHKNTIISEWLWLLLIYFATECLSVRLLSILYFFLTESDCPTDGMKFNVGQASCDTISVSFVSTPSRTEESGGAWGTRVTGSCADSQWASSRYAPFQSIWSKRSASFSPRPCFSRPCRECGWNPSIFRDGERTNGGLDSGLVRV